MAIIAPFAALRYDERKAGRLEALLTQPYDKITPEMQREYFARSPFNLAHLVKGEVRPGDTPENSVYRRAASLLRTWQEQGVLVEPKSPALYLYWQEFWPPEMKEMKEMKERKERKERKEGKPLIRKAIVALGKLEPYDAGVVFRHEQTLTGPKADRLELLRTVKTQFEQIFLLYTDPAQQAEKLLEAESQRPPDARAEDDYGVIHTMWQVEDPAKIQAVQEILRDKKLVIADGHHRYETGLNFERECRAARPHDGLGDCSYIPMALINTESEGIVILPTHRVVKGIAGLNREGFHAKAAPYFERRQFRFFDAETMEEAGRHLRQEMAAAAARGRIAIGVLFAGADSFDLLELRLEVNRAQLWPGLLEAERALDVTALHHLIFERCLGVDEEAVREERFLTYVREFEEGIHRVTSGEAQACFFVNSVTIGQVMEIALAGRVMPQKSTDFYPKVLSGLVMYRLRS